MPSELYWNTVTPVLKEILLRLMHEELFKPFRLVGGTSLSLQVGHRMSVDIDLFTDSTYDSIDFTAIDKYLRQTFPYITIPVGGLLGVGHSYFVGNTETDAVKLDIYYIDPFIQAPLVIEDIRMATFGEIIAMKVDIVQRIRSKSA